MRKNARLGGLILGLALVTARAHATPEVVVACPGLAEDARASVEARAQADLAVKGLEDGLLSVDCSDATGRVTFRWGELERTTAGPLPDEVRARVETLLSLVGALTTEVQRARTPSAPAPILVPIPVPPAAAPVPVPPAATSAPMPPAATSLPTPPAAAPAPAPAAAVPAPVLPSVPPAAALPQNTALPPAAASPPAAALPPRPLATLAPDASSTNARPWHLGAGVQAELWATEVAGAGGFRLRGGRKLVPPIALSIVLAADRGSSEPDDVLVRLWRGGFEAAASATEALCVVLGGQLTRMIAEGPASWSPASHAKTSFAGTLRLDYVIPLGQLELVPGAGILVSPARRTVTLDGQRVLSVPRLTGSAIVELRWPF